MFLSALNTNISFGCKNKILKINLISKLLQHQSSRIIANTMHCPYRSVDGYFGSKLIKVIDLERLIFRKNTVQDSTIYFGNYFSNIFKKLPTYHIYDFEFIHIVLKGISGSLGNGYRYILKALNLFYLHHSSNKLQHIIQF